MSFNTNVFNSDTFNAIGDATAIREGFAGQPTARRHIIGFNIGRPFKLIRTFSPMPTGLTLSTATLNIRAERADDDQVLTLTIISDQQSAGQITDDNTDDGGDVAYYFMGLSAQTTDLESFKDYWYEILLTATDGEPEVIEDGFITWE